MSIRARHALTIDEVDFCKRFGAGLLAAEAYRRSFLDVRRRVTYERAHEGEADVEVPSKEVSRRASRLIKESHIKAYLVEMEENESQTARTVLFDQARFGDDPSAMRAAKEIFDREDKLGIRDAVMQFWDITRQAGAEIVVPLPTHCNSCGAQIEVSVPVGEMFPEAN
jgi:predicted Zn-ribbon and HTH transcriptional regulator